jgi:hypothetical protein
MAPAMSSLAGVAAGRKAHLWDETGSFDLRDIHKGTLLQASLRTPSPVPPVTQHYKPITA